MDNTLLPPDTAALCVDTRASLDFGARGLVAQELVEGLGHHLFEQDGPLVLAHPQQELAATFRRTNTKKPALGSWLAPKWESKFLQQAQIGWFHRFLPIDHVKNVPCQSITTLLPPLKKMPFYLSRKNGHHFVVPSRADADRIERLYSIPSAQVSIVPPTVRRVVAAAAPFQFFGERGVLIVRDGKRDGMDKHERVVRKCFPHKRILQVNLRDRSEIAPDRWVRTLQNTSICFYLVQRPFDWSTLALETLYWNIPTIYADQNSVLSETIPQARLKLNTYLADPPTSAQLHEQTAVAREELEQQGLFEPDQQAVAYKELYERLGALGLG